MKPTIKRWLKRLSIVAGALVVILCIGLWWVLGTQSGMRFVLARASSITDGKLQVGEARGKLAGPLELQNVAWVDPEADIDAHIDALKVDPVLSSLFAGTVHVANLEISGTNVSIPAGDETESTDESAGISLQPPIDMRVDRLRVHDAEIKQAGDSLFVVNVLKLAGAWTHNGIDLDELKLRSPDGRVDLNGKLGLTPGYTGSGHGRFQWQVDDQTWAGKLNADSDGKQAELALAITQPVSTNIKATVQQRDAMPWHAHITMPKTDPSPLLGEGTLDTLALDLTAQGNRSGGRLTGDIQIDDTGLHIEPLRIDYNADEQRIILEKLALTSPQIEGKLNGEGQVDLGAQPIAANMHLDWDGVRVPEELAGQELASHGELTFDGDANAYTLSGDLNAGPPEQLAHLQLDLDGNPEQIQLRKLDIQQSNGHLDTKGRIDLKPDIAWDLTVDGDHFDPGKLFADWDGSLNIDLSTQGQLTDAGPEATLDLSKLGGTLRQRVLHGQGKLHVTPDRIVDGHLDIASGDSTLNLQANGGDSNDIDLHLTIAALSDWSPNMGGAVRADLNIRGKWPRLGVKGNIHGRQLAMADNRIQKVDVQADVPNISDPGGNLDVRAVDLLLGGLQFDSAKLTGTGDADQHELDLKADGDTLSLQLALAGHMQDSAWDGRLTTLTLAPQGMPQWQLRQPTNLTWDNGKAKLSRLCLSPGKPELCLDASRNREGAMQAEYDLSDVPLALALTAAGNNPPVRGDGTLNGKGHFEVGANGDVSGHAAITSSKGDIHYINTPDKALLSYHDFAVNADLAPQETHVTVGADLYDNGQLKGNLDMTGSKQNLAGNVALHLDSVQALELFTDAVANVDGSLDSQFRLGGTLDAPDIDGRAQLQGFAAELPAAGLKLHDGMVDVATHGPGRLDIDGHIASGDGTLKLGGRLGLDTETTTKLTIKGDHFEAADIPGAEAVISPDIALIRSGKGMNVNGSVGIDSADIKLEKLPTGSGGGGIQPSSDVVIEDAENQREKQAALPVTVDVTVNLGKDTKLAGYGLDGQIYGSLNVTQRPGHATKGRGQVSIDGTYKAYGQDLSIEKGQLLFASTPIDNPGLNIRAVRDLQPTATIDTGQKVGLQISGTAQRPIIEVFSNPAMQQSDALSYLITGKPLSSVSGGEGNAVNTAAQALGSVTGDLLAKGIGSKLGVQAGVSSNEALGTTAFTVGKYLSPRMYLSYGVGLFDPGQVITLRYILNRHWNFEAKQATEFNRASFNYRIEK